MLLSGKHNFALKIPLSSKEIYVCYAFATLLQNNSIRSNFYMDLANKLGFVDDVIPGVKRIRTHLPTFSEDRVVSGKNIGMFANFLIRHLSDHDDLHSLQNTFRNEFGISHSGSLETGFEPYLRHLESAFDSTDLIPLKSPLICNSTLCISLIVYLRGGQCMRQIRH